MVKPIPKPIPVQSGQMPSQTIGKIYADAVPVFIHEHVLEQIIQYSESDLTREVGGFLLGGYHIDKRPYLEIRHFEPAIEARSNVASITISHHVWARLHRQLEDDYPTEILVGWHHTHPGHGVFLSGYDLFIHENYFDQKWHVALVVDPIQKELCFFQWRGEEIVDCGFVCVSNQPQ